jgi:hypothetical protein
MKKFKEYYKKKIIESLNTELVSQEAQPVQTQTDFSKSNNVNNYNISNQQDASITNRVQGTGNPPIGFNPPDENWPPIPGNPLPTYVHPDGSQVWVIPGPPTSIYTIRPNPFYPSPFLDPNASPWIYEMTVNQSDYPGLHQIQNPYHNWQWNPATGQWQRTTPGQRLDKDGNIVPAGLRLWEIWPGWQQPDFLPPSRKGQDGQWNQGGQEWDIVPGYNNEYAPGYYPNYVISPTNQPNM